MSNRGAGDTPAIHAARRIALEGAHNVRDLGDLPAEGGRTRRGVLLRGDALDALSVSDVERLVEEVGLAHVVDLRSAGERAERGRGRLGDTEVSYSELDVIHDDVLARRRVARAAALEAGADPEVIMAEGYVELLELGAAAFVTALERIVSPGGTPVLVHCAAGKDRTGVFVALLLDAAGVDREGIIADYAATQANMYAIVERLRAASAYQSMVEEVPGFVFDARLGTMRHFLQRLDDTWGGAAGFLEANGTRRDTLDRWRSLLVA
jgi:protein tyrosine/serine phosphatase